MAEGQKLWGVKCGALAASLRYREWCEGKWGSGRDHLLGKLIRMVGCVLGGSCRKLDIDRQSRRSQQRE